MTLAGVTALLLDPTRGEGPAELIDCLGQALVADGVPVSRFHTGIPALHPELTARALQWSEEAGARVVDIPHEALHQSNYIDSPIAAIRGGNVDSLRRRLAGPGAGLDYEVCRDLAAEGFTDYLAAALRLGSSLSFMSCASRAPCGFSDQAIDAVLALRPLLGLRLGLESEREAKRSLLHVYLGRSAGDRVIAGEVRRGRGQRLRAAVWYCDLRGFTAMADGADLEQTVASLDRYFDSVATPVLDHGGEILKFIGDAMLAIFDEHRCPDALAAAVEAQAAAGAEGFEIGCGLHVGEVLFGNIGGRQRLDFTVIGPAVNEACRVESLCKSLQRGALMTAEFAERCAGATLTSVGFHALRGVARPRELFAVAPPDDHS